MDIYTLIKRLAYRPRATGIQAALAPQEQAWQAWLHPEVQVSVRGDQVIVCGEVATQAERNRLLATVSRLTGGAVQDLIRVVGAELPQVGTEVARCGAVADSLDSAPPRLRLVTAQAPRADKPSLVKSRSG